MKLYLLAPILALSALAADLPVADGLIFHLDARAQREARSAAGLPPIGNLQPADYILDSSTNHAFSFQAGAEHRPLFIADDQAAYLKFDGKDDFLHWRGGGRAISAVTIVILAAPKANPGGFTGMFATAESGKNDYTSGINFDFGPGATKELSVLNVESAGSIGFRDLLQPGFFNASERPFGDFHVFTARSKPGKSEVFLDGFKGGERERAESVIGLDHLTVGSRIYSNDGTQPPFAQGFFDGAIAEVLVFNRAITEPERQSLEQGLLAKTVALNALLHGARGHALEAVKDPPVVQMLVPGFTVQELPLKIGNLNNVRYRPDGKVMALGYDGRIHLLSDSDGDGDGLEDKDELFWDQQTLRAPIGMALTPKDYSAGDGIFVASKGKVSLILDKDRDGRADEERVIASGWNELPHGVDTLGLAVDPKDGSIYFGLGCANFVDAYLIDPSNGRSRYRLDDIHGTIQRISADFSKRETICTGVRFTCALAFNQDGDLFATDQEGATWLPNGNPLDELLHIQLGKHYGFPPRHPKHLPDVIDEPAISEFPPQHQSTVGMVFNTGVNGGPHFGPSHWAGDAIVCGESRGKIWRTKLAKTPLGYVAENQLIACLGLLTIDASVTPAGDLLVACHSGPPDWGTGPAGQGRLFKIRYTGKDLPQPVRAWAAAPDEFRIAFDRALKPADWARAKDQVKVEAGQYVSAGDPFETIRPGYQVVRDQMAMPRRWVDVLGLSLGEDSRTVVLHVPRQTEAANYAITLPLPDTWKQKAGIAQHPQMDLLANLNGLVATVTSGGQEIRAILPHPSLAAAEALTKGSADHERFFRLAHSPTAVMRIQGNVNTSNPFVPAVQPGSKIDWDTNTDPFASTVFSVKTDYEGETEAPLDRTKTGHWKILQPLVLNHPSPSANGLFLASEKLRHSLSTSRVFVPWATQGTNAAPVLAERTDVKGNWLRGRRVFFSEVGCSTCHTIRGQGIAFGPDLSNLVFRDRDSVLNDILHPSSTINPDHPGTQITLKDGTTLSGIIRSLSDQQIKLALPAGAQTEIARGDMASMEALKTSLMPERLGERMTSAQLEDLLTFLLINPLEPATIARTEPPKPAGRHLPELTDVVGSLSSPPTGQATPLRILLCSGAKDHGLNEHDYPLWLERWARLLALGENVTVSTCNGFPTSEQLANADAAVFYNANPGWNEDKAAVLDAFQKRGGGAIYLHYAIDGGKDPAGVAERMGLTFTLGSKFRHGEFDLAFPHPTHPITRDLPTIHFTDETYWNMRGDLSRLNILGTAVEEGSPRPILWTLEREKSRVVGCIPGHYTWTFDDPLYRVLVLRSICWAARQENVDRLAELALVGAHIVP